MTRTKKLLWSASLLFAVLVAVLSVAWLIVSEPLPESVEGEAAEALATRIETAVNVEAWRETGAVEWTFRGRNTHLWDRTRDVCRVQIDNEVALMRDCGPNGRAYRDGTALSGSDAQSILNAGHTAWINDSFWLNPIAKLRDEGVTRSLVELEDGTEALLVSYSSGGLTPGDSYLWIPGEDGTPSAWRLWVSIIPIGGLEVSWEGWQTLDTGARISTQHVGPAGVTVDVSDVRGAATLEELTGGDDPFAPLFEEG